MCMAQFQAPNFNLAISSTHDFSLHQGTVAEHSFLSSHQKIMEDLGLFQPPDPDYFAQHPDHLWEAGKLNMDLDDIFTTLPRQFNFMSIPILDRDAFRLEASHVASITHDRAGFYELLQTHLEARRKEQLDMMMHALLRLAGDPEQIGLPDRTARHWGHAMHIARSKSFDTIVRFLAGFLRDEEPADGIATLAAGHDDHSMRQPDTAYPTQNSKNSPSDLSPEIFSPRSSSVSTTDKSQKSSTVNSPQKRKRSFTPATANDDEGEDEAQLTKKLRFTNDTVEPRAASSSRRSITPRARRVRKGQPPSIPQPSRSTVSPTTRAPSPSVGPRPSADEASSGDPTERCGNVSRPPQIYPGDSGQHAGSGLVHPDEKDKEKHNTRDKHNEGPAATGPKTRQGSCFPRPRKGKPPAARIQKYTASRPERRAKGEIAGHGSRGRGAGQQTRSSQRLTRQRGQGVRSFHELDSHGKARSVVA